MNIMIDYDNTYTADPIMWRNLLPRIQGVYGHSVYLVTSRDSDTPVETSKDFENMGIPIIYAAYRAKRRVCEEQGIEIDVWIDDEPKYIDTGFVD